MKKITVITGFGYYKDQQGRIVSKAELPIGPHDLIDGLTYTEANSQALLNAIEVYQVPPTAEQINETKIQNKMRAIAIEELKITGDLPADYIDTVQ